MKRLLHYAMLAALMFTVACEGEEGPPGPQGEPGQQGPQGTQGPQGPPGASQTGQVLDLSGWTFTAEDEYALGLEFAQYGVEVLDSDIVLVYRFSNAYEDDNGDVIPVWSALPQTVMFDEGMLQYGFVYSYEVLLIFLDTQFDIAELGEGWTTDQVFRIVVVPGEAVNARTNGETVDHSNYEEVIRYYNLSDKKVPKYTRK